jgi:hypothetical protein
MLSRGENRLHPGPVRSGDSLVLGEKVLKLDKAFHTIHLACHDHGPEIRDPAGQGINILGNPRQEGLEGTNLFRRQAKFALEFQGKFHIFSQPRT